MSRNGGARSSGGGKNGSLVAGILIGMVAGLSIAGAVAWYITKSPSPYQSKEAARETKPAAEAPKPAAAEAQAKPAPAAAPAQAASAVGEGKPRFEFYKVLTDKQEGVPAAPKTPAHQTQKESPKPAQPSVAKSEPHFLQAGSFSNADDADKLKARLALLGLEASVQTVTIPDKGVWHRVRLGPYTSADEMNKARLALKQNGVDAAPVRAQ